MTIQFRTPATTGLIPVPAPKRRAPNKLDFTRMAFPLDELGPVPSPPESRVNRFTEGTPHDKGYIDTLIRRVLETIRSDHMLLSDAAAKVSMEFETKHRTLLKHFEAYRTKAEHDAADVYGAVRKRRDNHFLKAMEEGNHATFSDLCRDVARREFTTVREQDIPTLASNFRRHASMQVREAVSERFPRIARN